MKFLLATAAVLAVSATLAAAGDKEYHAIKKWAMLKACESCYGPDNMKLHLVKVKKAVAKCAGASVPELELPMFKQPYRTVTAAMVHAAFNPQQQQEHGEGMTHSHDGLGPHHHPKMPYRDGPYAPGRGADDDADMLERLFKRMFYKKMVAKIMNEDFLGDDDEDGESDMGMAYMSGAAGKAEVAAALRKHFKTRPMRRFSRQADNSNAKQKEIFQLSERLTEKLAAEKTKMEEEVARMECVLQECGIVDENFDLRTAEEMKAQWKEEGFTFADPWLEEKMCNDVDKCVAFANAIPEEVLEDCKYGPKLAKVKVFKKCMKMRKMKTCMNFDVKRQIESNFAPLADLVEQTEVEEKYLLPMVQSLLHGGMDFEH